MILPYCYINENLISNCLTNVNENHYKVPIFPNRKPEINNFPKVKKKREPAFAPALFNFKALEIIDPV